MPSTPVAEFRPRLLVVEHAKAASQEPAGKRAGGSVGAGPRLAGFFVLFGLQEIYSQQFTELLAGRDGPNEESRRATLAALGPEVAEGPRPRKKVGFATYAAWLPLGLLAWAALALR